MQQKPDKMERIAARLQNRVAELTARYELDIIVLQDEIDELKEEIKELTGDSEKKEDPEQ